MTDDSHERGQRLARSGMVVSAMTFLSRILGLVRDVVVAFFFGASASADAFFLAFKIPNFFRRLFAEGAFSQAFVPVMAQTKQEGHGAIRELIDFTSGALGFILLLVTILGVLGSSYLIMLFGFGYVIRDDSGQLLLAGELLRFTFPYLALISLTAFAGSILNAFGRFAVPAFTPVILNLCLIAGAFYSQQYMDLPVQGLAVSVLLAGVFQLVFQLPALARLGLIPRPRLNFKHPKVVQVLTLMLPAVFGASISQLNLLLDTMLATFLVKGSIAWLYYADRLLELPLAMIGIALATVILPALSSDVAAGDGNAFSRKLDWGLRWIAIFGFPAAAALVVLAEPLIVTIFYRGAMTAMDVSMSSLALKAYAAGLLGHMAVKILAPGFFARQDMKTPVRIGVIALLSNMVLNLAFILWLGHIGLALATSASAFINAFLLWKHLREHGIYQPQAGWLMFLAKITTATSVMVFGLLSIAPEVDGWLAVGIFEKATWLIGLCFSGAMTYFLLLWGMGFRAADLRIARS